MKKRLVKKNGTKVVSNKQLAKHYMKECSSLKAANLEIGLKNRQLFEQVKENGLKIQEMAIRNDNLEEWYKVLRTEIKTLETQNKALMDNNRHILKENVRVGDELIRTTCEVEKYKQQLETVGKQSLWKKVFKW